MFIKPIDLFFCAVGFSSSSFDKDIVYTDAFVRPLYLPPVRDRFKKLKRIKRPEGLRFTGSDDEVRDLIKLIEGQVVPFFHTCDAPQKIAAGLDHEELVRDPYELEAIALSCVLLRDAAGARTAFARAIEVLSPDEGAWAIEMATRLRAMRERMELSVDQLTAQLRKWRSENIDAMGLMQYSNEEFPAVW